LRQLEIAARVTLRGQWAEEEEPDEEAERGRRREGDEEKSVGLVCSEKVRAMMVKAVFQGFQDNAVWVPGV